MASANLNIMIKAARKAGRSLVKDFREVENLQVSVKGAGDFVSRADREAERIIKEELRGARPNYGWLGEETGTEPGEDPTRRWLVDPLDGTTNFIHGLPQYAVSIALARGASIEQAVVFDPTRNELFTASKGAGAFLNDRRIRVSRRTRLENSLLGTGFPYRMFDHVDTYLAIFKELTRKTAGLRRPGAAALDLAYVACGRYDGFWEFGLSPWDMAAGALLIAEAGGLVSDMRGEAGYLVSGNIIAGTPKVFAPLLNLIRERLPESVTA